MRGVALLALAFAALTSGGAVAQSSPSHISWADSKHGWVAYPSFTCKPAAALCATENGGRTWHGIWLGRAGEISGYQRTSVRAGLLVDRNGVWWTRDNGSHWYQTSRVVGPAWVFHGGELIVASGKDLTRVRPWPPRGRARCPIPFNNGTLPGSGSHFRRNVCAAVVDAGMRLQDLARVRADDGVVELTPVPNGAAGIGSYCECNTSAFEFFVWRPAGFCEVDLAVPPGYAIGVLTIRVSWPEIFVYTTATPSLHVIWHSVDGGRTFDRTVSG